MSQRHKHYDVIIAFANGKAIQYKNGLGGWVDCRSAPSFASTTEYRVKPEALKWRCALMRYGGVMRDSTQYTVHACTWEEQKREPREKWQSFVCWLGDWQEAEIPSGEVK